MQVMFSVAEALRCFEHEELHHDAHSFLEALMARRVMPLLVEHAALLDQHCRLFKHASFILASP
jgi:hypothetical protein